MFRLEFGNESWPVSEIDPSVLLECAVEAVHAAGAHALGNAHRRTEAIERAKHDVKLRLDVECQEKAESVIHARFPDHAVLGEESGAGKSVQAEHEWVIDPIDGTVNFSHGMPLWACSIGVRDSRCTLAAAVYAPELDELYTATAERPSECNGSSIRVSDIDEVEESMVFTGLDKNVLPDVPPYEIFKKIAVNAQKTRVMGCASHDMCRVACGQGEGYFEAGIHIWDVAASGLIVQQAGGRAEVIGRYADNRLQFLATNGRIHEELKKLVELNA